MSLLAQRRAFLMAFRKLGTVEAAAASLNLEPSIHDEWMKDWLYRGAFADVQKDREADLAAIAAGIPPPAPKRPPGRPRKPEPPEPPPKRPRGRPRKALPPPVEAQATITPAGSPDEPAPQIAPESPPEPAQPKAEPAPEAGTIIPSKHGYTRLFVPDEDLPAAPEPEPKAKAKPPEPAPEPSLDLTFASNPEQRALIDEFGELDRRMKVRAMDQARYESLKKAIKSWFCGVPPDADGSVQGDRYLLHLSACEKEREVRNIRELVDLIGLDAVLDLVIVPITKLENGFGQSRVEHLITEKRTGSRRIRCVPMFPATPPACPNQT